jgi:hypothetical protein
MREAAGRLKAQSIPLIFVKPLVAGGLKLRERKEWRTMMLDSGKICLRGRV